MNSKSKNIFEYFILFIELILYLVSFLIDTQIITFILVILSFILFYFLLKDKNNKINLNFGTIILFGFLFFYIFPLAYLSIRYLYYIGIDQWNVFSENSSVVFLTNIAAFIFIKSYRLIAHNTNYYDLRKNYHKFQLKFLIAFISLILFAVVVARFLLVVNGVYYWAFKEKEFLFGQYYSILTFISNLGVILPISFGVLYAITGKFKKTTFLLFTFELIWYIPSGARLSILQILFAIIIIIWLRNKSIPKKEVVIFSILAIVFMASFSQYRYAISSMNSTDKISIESTLDALDISIRNMDNDGANPLINNLDQTFNRFYDGQYFAYLLKNYRHNYKYEFGSTYYSRISNLLIPYFIVKHEQIMQLSLNEYYKLILGGSNPLTFLGEAYINFGIPGVLTIPIFLGLILGYFENKLLQKRNEIFIIIVSFWFMVYLPFMVTQTFPSILGNLRNAIVIIITFIVLKKIVVNKNISKSITRTINTN